MRKHLNTYVAHLHSRPAHHRRRFSMQAAGVITIAVFLVWLSTLGVRLATSGTSAPLPDSAGSAAALLAGDAAIPAQPADASLQQQSAGDASQSAPDQTAPASSDAYPN